MNVRLKYSFQHEDRQYLAGRCYDLEAGLASHLINHGLANALPGSEKFVEGEERKGERFKPNNPNFDTIIRAYRSPAQRAAKQAQEDEEHRRQLQAEEDAKVDEFRRLQAIANARK